MFITASVQVTIDDADVGTPDAVAEKLLAALGGDPVVDTCIVNLQVPQGTAGKPYEPGTPTF